MDELISVIIPIHNAEKYLRECINSIIEQTYKNLEIILVDDDSTDQSGAICDDYRSYDSRIRVIHKKESAEGGAGARNHGINVSTGALLYFMDSDDYVEKDMLRQMYDKLCEENSQCVVCSFHYIGEDCKELPWRTPQLTNYSVMTGHDAAKTFLTTMDIEGFSWNKLFRREIFDRNNIQFDQALNSFVDMYGMFRGILHCKYVSFCPQKFYYYRQRAASCVHTMSIRKLSNYKKVIMQITEEAYAADLIQESRFFYQYRMMLQLYDAIKGKIGYNNDEWIQIKSTYQWKKIFECSYIETNHILQAFLNHRNLKDSLKLFIVWWHFR